METTFILLLHYEMSEIKLQQRFSLTIPGSLTSLNEYIRIERGASGKFLANKVKQNETEMIAWIAKQQLRDVCINTPCFIETNWYCETQRQDPDNVVFAKKFILDGLVMAGTLKNDTMEYVVGFMDTVNVDKSNPRIEVNLLTY